METTKDNNQGNNQNSNSTGANIPEWVMHLLTGLGTMGAEYMMFIKPLQEKMELQTQLLKTQEERIKQLETVLKERGVKLKLPAEDVEEEDDDDTDTEIFQVKRKPAATPKHRKFTQVKL